MPTIGIKMPVLFDLVTIRQKNKRRKKKDIPTPFANTPVIHSSTHFC